MAEMTREEAITKSIEMYPVFVLGNIVDVNEQIRAAYMRGFDDAKQTKERMTKTREQIEQIALERWPDDGFHGINQEKRQAFIEGALMVVETYAQQQVKSDVAEVVKSKCKTCNGKKLRRESDGSIVICLDC